MFMEDWSALHNGRHIWEIENRVSVRVHKRCDAFVAHEHAEALRLDKMSWYCKLLARMGVDDGTWHPWFRRHPPTDSPRTKLHFTKEEVMSLRQMSSGSAS